MRQAFVSTIVKLAERDPRILLLTGDLGYTVLEPFAEKFPDRFFNVGVAEQNMVGIATGLSEAGFIPFLYSIATFASLRPYEFIRNGPILHQFPVRIVGVGGGFEYGHAGATHHALEDVGVMRVQPGITLIAPADCEQARTAILATWNLPGPVYYRLGKDDRTTIDRLGGRFELGKAEIIGEGTNLLLISMGSITTEAIEASNALASQGINCTLLVVASLNPPPIEDLINVLSRFPLALTIEAHYLVGGLGSLVSEIIAERGIDCRIVRCAVKETPQGISGSQSYLYQINQLSSESLVETALRTLKTL